MQDVQDISTDAVDNFFLFFIYCHDVSNSVFIVSCAIYAERKGTHITVYFIILARMFSTRFTSTENYVFVFVKSYIVFFCVQMYWMFHLACWTEMFFTREAMIFGVPLTLAAVAHVDKRAYFLRRHDGDLLFINQHNLHWRNTIIINVCNLVI